MRTRTIVIAALAASAIAFGAYSLSAREVFLTAPAELKGGTVKAAGRVVATIESPEMVHIRFRSLPQDLLVEKRGYKPIRVPIDCPSDCYPEITQNQVVAAAAN
jgi:hypothetical protein